MEPQKAQEYKLSMAALNGIIITLIGVLVLLTPVFAELPEKDLKADLLAGALLTIGGAVTAAWGLFRKKQIETDDAADEQEIA